MERLQALLCQHPDDLFLHRELQRRTRYTPESSRALVEQYRSLAREHANDPRFLYLYGRALQRTDDSQEARTQFEEALERDRRFAWSHLGLAALSQKDPRSRRKHLRRFWDLCPGTLEGYDFVGASTGLTFNREAAAKLRAILEPRTDLRAIQAYSTLWPLEFQVHPPIEHEAVRAGIKGDLARLRSLSRTGDMHWYLTLREGYELDGDPESKRWAEDEFLRRFDHTEDALDMVTDRWMAEHPTPSDEESPAAKRYARALYRETGEWVKGWPDYPFPWIYRLAAVVKLTDLSDRETVAVADGFLKALKSNRGEFSGSPPLEFQVARLYVDRRLRLAQVPGLVEGPLHELEERLHVEDEGDARMRTSLEDALEYTRWQGWSLLVEAALARKDLRRAREVVARMEKAAPPAVPGLAAVSVVPAASAKRDATATDAPAEDAGERALTDAWHRATLRYWEGRLAEAEKHTADAWVHYRGGLLELPGGVRSGLKETRDRLETAARSAWKKLGGTEKGWSAALLAAQGEESGLTASMTGGWEDRKTELPGFAMYDLAGKRWTQAQLRGKVSFINVWATWCGPCQGELPHLQKLHERLRGNSSVQLLTFNVDGNTGLVAPFLKQRGFTFATLLAGDYPDRVRAGVGIPRNWIVDREGRLIREQVGFGDDGESWVSQALAEIDKAAGTH